MPDEAQELEAPQGERETQPAQSKTGNRIEDLPEWAQQLIRETRGEAAARRKRLEEIEAEHQKAQDARLEEEKRWQELAEQRAKKLAELEPLAERVKEVNEALEATVKVRVDRLPEDARSLVPDFGDARKTLDWLNANEQRLTRPLAPNTDAGVRGDAMGAAPKLTDMERKLAKIAGMTPEQWAAQRQRGLELEERDDLPR